MVETVPSPGWQDGNWSPRMTLLKCPSLCAVSPSRLILKWEQKTGQDFMADIPTHPNSPAGGEEDKGSDLQTTLSFSFVCVWHQENSLLTSGKFPFWHHENSLFLPMFLIFQSPLLHPALKLLALPRAFGLAKITGTQRPPEAILKCCFLGEHHGEGRRIWIVLERGNVFHSWRAACSASPAVALAATTACPDARWHCWPGSAWRSP